MIGLLTDAISLPQLSAMLPGRPTLTTLRRWVKVGVGGVTLVSFKVGGRRFVTRAAVLTFIKATSGDDADLNLETPARRKRRAKRQSDWADQVLADAGI